MEDKELQSGMESDEQLTAEEKENYQRLLERVDLLTNQSQYRTMQNWMALQQRIHRTRMWFKTWNAVRTAAAILLVPLATSIYLLIYQQNQTNKQYAETVETVTACGVVSKVVLPDSSVVWLNSNSTITYPRHFTGKRRDVTLSGEAYFKVTAHRDRQFTVHTPEQVAISAYGTEFNVLAYKHDSRIEATLNKGHIEVVTPNHQLARLKVGQTAVYDKDSRQLQVNAVDLWEKTGWREGKIIFRRTNIRDIALTLSRHYNVEFIIKGRDVNDYVFSATFSDENIEEVLDILKMSAPMHYQILPSQPQPDMSFPKKRILINLGDI